MSGRHGIVQGDYAIDKLYRYIKENKNVMTKKGMYPFKIWVNDRHKEIYNEQEFEINVQELIHDRKIYDLSLDGLIIELNSVHIICNDTDWDLFS